MKKLKIKADTTLKYLQVFNGILELTYRELQVLSKLIDSSATIDLCSVVNKKLVAKDMGIKDYNTLNNYVKRLKDKGAIKKNNNGYELNSLLVPSNKVVIEITNSNG
tara:strand:- start:1743 stop:2063 length:321 start_codon:yes stop_codon:yes gene_type:complete